MKYSKPKYYLIAFSLFYLFLIGIMIFYFLQVLDLKRKEIHKIAHDRIDEIEGLLAFEKKTKKKDNVLYHAVLDLLQKKATIEEIQEQHASYFESTSKDATQKIDSAFADLGYKMAYRIDLTHVILNSTKENVLNAPVTILETEQKIRHAHRVNSSEWEVEESSKNKSDETCLDCPEDYSNHFIVKQEKYIEVLNFNSIALRELAPLLLTSLFICIFILILYFITYKTIKKKEQEVLSLHNMVDNVSHEFKLPIATLKYGCNNLKQEYDSPTVALIQRQIDRLERLQNQLGVVVDANELPFSQASFIQLIEDLKLRNQGIDFKISWKTEEDIQLPQTAIETIILNLIENGIKYGGTQLTCSIQHKENKLYIEVSDNGIGIEKKEQNLIFRKFYRIIHNNVHNTLGLGIGLYQVKQIVDKYQGNIQVHSKLKVGTTFIICIPYA
ncbi:sensor histidine kinase [Myroides odoratus]|uniref:sensor histidine kinase n=1 Tax=Myroides odoratus TaxID=256 RepID=UPI0007658351|nr:HAMP domain-containing sensor histidine kinase [Myroides odoratus]